MSILHHVPPPPSSAFFLPLNVTVVQGPWQWAAAGSGLFVSYFLSNGLINDEITMPVSIASGTYKFILVGRQLADSGIVTVSLNGVSVGTIDLYSVGAVELYEGSISNVVVSQSKIHTLSLKMASKHAASTGYACRLYCMSMVRTA